MGDPDAVPTVDVTRFPKNGTTSVGVKRRYSGTLGRTYNCQVGVILGYHATRGHTLIGRRPFLPEEWADDRPRREDAGVPVSRVTEDFLGWACGASAGDGTKVLVPVWGNAAWHVWSSPRIVDSL